MRKVPRRAWPACSPPWLRLPSSSRCSVIFIGRHFHGRWLLNSLSPAVPLVAGLVFVSLPRSAKHGYAGIVNALMVIFLLFGAIVSWVTTLLLAWVD